MVYKSDKTPTQLLCCDQLEPISVDNRLKTEPFSCVTMSDTNWSLKERCTSDDMSTVSTGIPMILPFLTRSFKDFEKKSCSSKSFGFFSNKLSLDPGFPHVFHCLFRSFREHQLGKNNIHLPADNDFCVLRRYIFKRPNFFFKYVIMNKYVQQLFLLQGATSDITKCDRFSKVRRLIKIVTKRPFKHLFNLFY